MHKRQSLNTPKQHFPDTCDLKNYENQSIQILKESRRSFFKTLLCSFFGQHISPKVVGSIDVTVIYATEFIGEDLSDIDIIQ